MLTLVLLVALGLALLLLLGEMCRRAYCRAGSTRTPTVRAVVYLVAHGQLLIMQRRNKGRLRARLEVPKGKIKDDETPIDAARRECYEESGLRPTDLQPLTTLQIRQGNGKRRGQETWYAFWGNVPSDTPIPFDHRVIGSGGDSGRSYHFRLVPLEAVSLYPPLDTALPALREALVEAVLTSTQ